MYGGSSAEVVGEMTTIGMRLLGGGRRPSLWDDGRNRLRNPLLLRPCNSIEVIDRNQSVWYGCVDSGWSLLERDAIVWVYEVGSGWGIGRDCGGGMLNSS